MKLGRARGLAASNFGKSANYRAADFPGERHP